MSTPKAPAEIMFGENIKIRLAELSIPADNDEFRKKDVFKQNKKMKSYNKWK